jgi:hypothetical protein
VAILSRQVFSPSDRRVRNVRWARSVALRVESSFGVFHQLLDFRQELVDHPQAAGRLLGREPGLTEVDVRLNGLRIAPGQLGG